MNATSFKTSVKREFWEHKTSLFWVPATIAGLIIVLTLIALIKGASAVESHGGTISFDSNEKIVVSEAIQKLADKPIEERKAAARAFLSGAKVPFDIMMMFIALFYFLSCLFDDRKDRSIYFWRSMPVSDWQTIASKLATGIIVLPLITLAAAVIVQLFIMVLGTFGAWYFNASAWEVIWSPTNLPLFIVSAFGHYMLAMLWAAPFIGFLMFVSAVTNRPMMYMILGPAIIMISEEILFDSSKFAHWIGERIMGVGFILWADMKRFAERQPDFPTISFSQGAELLANQQFWIGLVIGTAFIYGAVYARKRLQEA